MKKLLNLVTLVVAATLIISCSEQTPQKSEVVIRGGMIFNESTLPYNGGVLVANFGTSELNPLNGEQKGYISFFDGEKVLPFIPADGALSAPKGMLIKDGYLLICDVNKLVAYKLDDLRAEPQNLTFPEGEMFVNDIAAAGDDIYISVTNTGNIFRLDGSNLAALGDAELTLWSNIAGANGVVVDGSTMYVASYPADGVTTAENVIYVIPDITVPAPVKLTSRQGQWDGLALSQDKTTLYSSSWTPEIVAIDVATGAVTPILFETEFIGAADFSLVDGVLYIPDLVKSQLIVKEL